jgi:hypothetical protein
MSRIFYTKHDRGLVAFIDGKSVAVSDTNENYAAILEALHAKDYAKVKSLASITTTINTAAAEVVTNGKQRIFVKDGKVWFNDLNGDVTELEGSLVDRILEAMRKGLTEKAIAPLVMFLDNVMKNKLKDIRNELYLFMMSGKMPITPDGHFLAYKKVKSDFKDIYTGKMDNSPGKLVSMPAEQVDTDRHNTCSRGLHFCTRGYLSSYGSGHSSKVVIVKVNPRHVFAIPSDYNNAKGRASEYYVIGECTGDVHKDEAFLETLIFDENKLEQAAPSVKFIADKKPSLKVLGEGYGLVSENKAWVRVIDSKGPLKSDKYSIVARNVAENGDVTFVSAITKKAVPADHVKEMSIETKSVRAALVRAVAKARNR